MHDWQCLNVWEVLAFIFLWENKFFFKDWLIQMADPWEQILKTSVWRYEDSVKGNCFAIANSQARRVGSPYVISPFYRKQVGVLRKDSGVEFDGGGV